MPEQSPVPSPWKSLQRTSIRAGVALLALIALWGLWYGYAAWRMAQMKDQLRARVELMAGVNQQTQPLSPDEDGIYLATRGLAVISLTPEEQTRASLWPESPAPANDLTENSLAEKQKVLVEGLALAKTKRIHWPFRANPFDATSFDVRLSQVNSVCSIRAHGAVAAQRQKLDQEALQAIDDAETCSAIADQGFAFMFHTSALNCEARAIHALAWIAPELELRSPSRPGGADRDFIFHLIARLQDQSALDRGMEHALDSQELFTFQDALPGNIPSYMKPSFMLDSVAQGRWQAGLRDALGRENVPTLLSMAVEEANPFANKSNLWSAAHVGRQALGPLRTKDSILNHFAVETMRNGAALRLALRLYELDNQNLPDRLEALVPGYVKALPHDLFQSHGRTLGYSRDKRILYSVGADGVDDGGLPAGRQGTVDIYDYDAYGTNHDIVFHLDRQPFAQLPPD
jgi:hypothetical protein